MAALLFVSLLLVFWVLSSSFQEQAAGPRVSYTTLLKLIDESAVTRLTLSGAEVQVALDSPRPVTTARGDTVTSSGFRASLPAVPDPSFLPLVRRHDVDLDVVPEAGASPWWNLIPMVLPFILLLGFGLYLMNRARTGGQGLLTMEQSGARLYDRTKEKTTFADVAGSHGAKQELQEIVDILKNPDRYLTVGAESPKGVLLVGPPGTGKTLLARAVAGESGVPFFSITGSDFMEMFVGVGAKRVRDLFESAKKAAPSIVFIDELDAVGGRRGAGLWTGGADERERTLNQLLSEMSGFEASGGVIVMAATNRPDVLDPALLRPGRFDRRIVVELPTQSDRLQILRLHARNMPLDPAVDLEALARSTPGFSGADLKNLLNEGALLAARKDRNRIRDEDLEEAEDKILIGLEREGLALTDREILLLSFHEAGHAVLAATLPHTDPLRKVTIVPRGRAMGVTQQLPERDRYVYERAYMLDRLTVMMGGRAAEQLVFDTSTSGAEDDLHEAEGLARRMVEDWGMSSDLGPRVVEGLHDQGYWDGAGPVARSYSEETARRVDQAVEEIILDAYERARATLERRRTDLEAVAAQLREKEELSGDQVLEILDRSRERPAEDPRKSPVSHGLTAATQRPDSRSSRRGPSTG